MKSELSLKKLEQFGQSFGQKVQNSNVIYMNALKEDLMKNEYQSILDYVHSIKTYNFLTIV